MKNSIIRILIVVLVAFIGQLAFSQNTSIKKLRKQRKEIQQLINLTNKQLLQTQRNEKNILKKINTLQNNLADRKELIKNYNKEIKLVNTRINQLEKEKKELEQKLAPLKKDYRQLTQSTQVQRNSYSKLIFLFSAKTFDQTWRRFRYLQEFTEYRKEQLKGIQEVKNAIDKKTDSLNSNKKEILLLVEAKKQEREKLNKAKIRQKKYLTSIQQKEKKLSIEFKKQVKKRDKIDKKIASVIREEIRISKKRRASKRKKTNRIRRRTRTTTYKTENNRFSTNFSKNRGKLPWPVSRGYISGRFGKHKHPTFRHVTINNKGTYFKSPRGSSAIAIFEGVVTRCFSLPGSGNAVIVQHGKYRSVYGNLNKIYVRVGQKVKAKQPIGQIYTDEEKGYSELLFQVWEETALQNPEKWIRK